MNAVQVYPKNSKTLKVTKKHDKHILQLTASCYSPVARTDKRAITSVQFSCCC